MGEEPYPLWEEIYPKGGGWQGEMEKKEQKI